MQNDQDSAAGFLFALGAYGLWGFLPLYLRLMDHIDPVEVIAHRALWSLPVAAIILLWLGRTGDIVPTIKTPKKAALLFLTAIVISLNWGIYVWAVSVDRTVEGALGYYINPLITICVGYVLLGERLTGLQFLAVLFAAAAVLLLAIKGGGLPWISLALAITFTTYSFIRKTVEVGPTQGFLVEVIFMALIAIPFIVWLQITGKGVFFSNTANFLLLLGCGPVTAIPLILFAAGAKRLRLSTTGLMQYIAPTIIFSIGVFVFKEPFDQIKLIAFILIWIALVLYSTSSFMQPKKKLT